MTPYITTNHAILLNDQPNARPVFEIDFLAKGIRIVALDVRGLNLFLASPGVLFAELGLPEQEFADPAELVEICKSHCLPKMKKAGNHWPFFSRWLSIEVETGLVVADFMLKTGLDSTGAVEIGYGVQPKFGGMGLMARTVGCFVEWAIDRPEVLRIKAETARDNIASSRILEKNGFRPFAPLVDSVWWEKQV